MNALPHVRIKDLYRYIGIVVAFVSFFILLPFSAHAQNVGAAIVLHPTEAIVNINSITPDPMCDFELRFSSGVIKNNLTLFGGTRNIASGTQYPIQAIFQSSSDLKVGDTYYVRLYISAGDVNIIYPPYAQDPMAVTVTADPNAPASTTTTTTDDATTTTSTTTTSGSSTLGINGGSATSNGGLVPCGNPGQPTCQFSNILDLISNVINFIFILVVPIAAAMFVVFGFRYITSGDDVKLKENLKGYFKNLIIGIIIVLVAWLAVATLLRTLGVSDAYVLLKL